MKIILTGGGSGGHIFPAIAVIEELELRKHSCLLILDKSSKRFLCSKRDIDITYIPIIKPSSGLVFFLWSLIFSYLRSLFLLKKKKPDVIVGFGGYATLPVLMAAYTLKIPIILHDSNSILGRINKMFLPMAKKIAFSFPSIQNEVNSRYQHKLSITGTPVLQEFSYHQYQDITDKINILVIGGSQGAKIFSDVIPEAIKLIKQEINTYICISQQCSAADVENVKAQYIENNTTAEVSTFFHNLATKLQEAHIIICRAGASTIAEVITAGKPAIYVPYPYAKNNHQQKNAEYIVENNGGIMVLQKDFTSQYLAEQIISLINDNDKMRQMANHAHKMVINNPNKRLADLIESVIYGGSGKI